MNTVRHLPHATIITEDDGALAEAADAIEESLLAAARCESDMGMKFARNTITSDQELRAALLILSRTVLRLVDMVERGC